MSSTPPKNHSALKAVLSVMCALLALGGLFLVFAAGSWIVKWLIPDANAETAVWMLVMLKAFGALALFLAYLLYHAARDPVRHATTITGLAYMLILLAALDVYAAYALGFELIAQFPHQEFQQCQPEEQVHLDIFVIFGLGQRAL